MYQNSAENQVVNNELLVQSTELPSVLFSTIAEIKPELLGKSGPEQEMARTLIFQWVQQLWHFMLTITNSVTRNTLETEHFKTDFLEKLVTFITHPDHGIIHSLYVYKGMQFIDKREQQLLIHGSLEDQQAQLMALLHDAMQTIPFNLRGEDCELNEYKNQKNDHAKIIADLVLHFGKICGLPQEKITPISFGLRHHDMSYHNYDFSEEFDYVSQLLHDADKLFGASYETDILTLVKSMLDRNYQVNKGAKGAYLLRELDHSIREMFAYGDRCFSDAVSVVRKEFGLFMITQTGTAIAHERAKHAVSLAKEIYGHYFDLTHEFIFDKIAKHFENQATSNLTLTVVGMDQTETDLQANSFASFIQEIENLYKTPIKINDAETIENRYAACQIEAHGLKIHVKSQEAEQNHQIDIHIDPSVARYCFMQDGRNQFVQTIEDVFSN